ncbi:penicillin-binding protein 2 [Dolichospermum sp. LEGE 00240]|jgi:penicillin-binding protein 2|uniref:penicillin-binding protein 2 n=1 Tax=Dolichospermum sp. LEGE 00240 TaxID=1828603 RepID=UPI00187FD2F9|nr:penicillin-binding protein 2 [Dolichospermum sp. LEGE 00240]MDM3844845.1 penicillin-binding protein 2 [Aphanizomenon gracile PMC638.10]MDM3850178.1 penicillin-binding protein 2 [Aphanizomenon gracile PMC627.10]MDM3856332.1 penicillin-binding protein 2 [Aphanizomenon gracile PMC649.10]MDM3862043.1 penicillin-binding protein 2 [Aphanizomenon gracile PMC644.10]MBE9247848.1 penicillin-binding protein 2 [Dolichospermum sp. LEGE 00240]
MTILPSLLSITKNTRTVGRGVQSTFVILFTLLMLSGIGARLIYLQIIEGKKHRIRAESNRIRIIPKQPERGNIFDRNGKLLASTRYPRSVYLWPMAHTKPSWSVVGPRLAKILDTPQTDIETILEQSAVNPSSLIRIARNLNEAQVTGLKEYENELPGVKINTEAVRYYPHGQELAHILGYTREITAEQLEKKKADGYRLGDVMGQMGVEKAYEKLLRGEWGGQQVEVDGSGRPLRVLGSKQAKAGNDLHLTIDLDMQIAAEKALGKRNGAIVAINPKNGSILAMVSHPTFDPNIFSKQKLSQKDWETVQGSGHPLVNRAISAFPPASTFKIVTTTAALESGKFSPDTVLQTYGSLTIGGTRFGEWNHAGFGPLGFVGAMQWSSDTFFYQIAKKVGGPTLIEWTRKYGFGQRTGFEFTTEESKGLVPDDNWKQKAWKIPWSVGDTVNMSIGQGALQATPLQTAVMFAVPANGGYRVQPHLLKDNEEAKSWRESLNLKPTTLKVLREGLRKVISEGTGKVLNVPNLPPVAGKSGTAEAWREGVKENHAWFGAYAPADKPEILVVAFAEHSGGGGGSVAAPMILEIMEKHFARK